MAHRDLPRLSSPADTDTIWAELRTSGVLILDAAAASRDEFERVTERLATNFRIHQDPERRRYVADDTTQGVSPGGEALALHAERAYLPASPELLFFYCAVPPGNGGATTVCDGAAIVDALTAADREQLAAMTLVWKTSLEQPMWQRMWSTTDQARAAQLLEEAIARHGERATHAFQGDVLHVEYETPALRTGPISGRPAFANYLLLSANEATGPQPSQADGSRVPADLLQRVATVADALTVDIAWRRGDVAVIDNTRCLHGRRAFSGGQREILVRMGDRPTSAS